MEALGGGKGFFYRRKDCPACGLSCCHGDQLCKQSSLAESAAPGHVSKLPWAAWVCLSSEPTPTGTGPGSLSTHSPGASAVFLPRCRELVGLFCADSVLPHFTVIQPALWTERKWGKSRRNPWSHDEHELVYLAEMSEWKAFPSSWRMRVPFADRQCGCPLMNPSNTLSHQFHTHTHTHTHTYAVFFSERFSHLLRVTQQVYVRCILNFYSQTCTLDFSIILRTSDHLEEPKCRWNNYLLPFHGCTMRFAKSQFLDQGLNLGHWSECTESWPLGNSLA